MDPKLKRSNYSETYKIEDPENHVPKIIIQWIHVSDDLRAMVSMYAQ